MKKKMDRQSSLKFMIWEIKKNQPIPIFHNY